MRTMQRRHERRRERLDGRHHGGSRRRPAISEILSVIMLTAAIAIGTALFVFTFMDQQDVAEEATRSHLELSSMRASELVTWSSAYCTDDNTLNFMLHNYGADNLSTADIRVYGTWLDMTREFNANAMSYTTLSDVPITGLDIRSGETAWTSVEMGCGTVDVPTAAGRDWVCINPNFDAPTAFSCEETKVSLITPAEDVVRVSVDEGRDPPRLPPNANIVSCRPPSTTENNTIELCIDTSEQPLPLTKIEAWSMDYGRYVNDNGISITNITQGDIRYSADGDTACFILNPNHIHHTTRLILVNDDGKSHFGQRPYVTFREPIEETGRVCHASPLNAPRYMGCFDGREIPAGQYEKGMCS